MPKILLFPLALMLLPAWAFGAQPDVTVELQNSIYTIRVNHAAPLSAVLEKFCKKSSTDCEGQPSVDTLVAPGTISGAWAEVISKLLEGTHLNYVASASSGAVPGKLEISAPSAATTTAPVPSVGQSSQAPGYEEPQPAVPEMIAVQESNPNMEEPGGSDAGSAQMPSTAYTQGSGAASASAAIAPFADSHGRPIAVSNEAVEYLPIPDSQNRPIPVNHDLLPGVPFADSRGNPIALQTGGTPDLAIPLQHH